MPRPANTATWSRWALSTRPRSPALPFRTPLRSRASCSRPKLSSLKSRKKRLQLLAAAEPPAQARSEEHTSELQSPVHLVCRLLLEKKKQQMHRDGVVLVSTDAVVYEHGHLVLGDDELLVPCVPDANPLVYGRHEGLARDVPSCVHL